MASVSVKVSDESAAIIQRKVDAGLYPNADAAWQQAIRLLLEKHGHFDVELSEVRVVDDDIDG